MALSESATAMCPGLGRRICGRCGHDSLLASTFAYLYRSEIANAALKHRMPTVSAYREYAEAGGLLTYGADLPAMFGRAAEFVDKILRGAKPGDLPVEQPMRFEMALNIKTARMLGVAIPASLSLRVDRVIE